MQRLCRNVAVSFPWDCSVRRRQFKHNKRSWRVALSRWAYVSPNFLSGSLGNENNCDRRGDTSQRSFRTRQERYVSLRYFGFPCKSLWFLSIKIQDFPRGRAQPLSLHPRGWRLVVRHPLSKVGIKGTPWQSHLICDTRNIGLLTRVLATQPIFAITEIWFPTIFLPPALLCMFLLVFSVIFQELNICPSVPTCGLDFEPFWKRGRRDHSLTFTNISDATTTRSLCACMQEA